MIRKNIILRDKKGIVVMKILRGFTLAETVVTLAVLGIVAAVVMPMLHRTTPNKEMLMFRKAYYLTSRVVTELINDEDLYPDADDEAHAGFANYDLDPPAKYHGTVYNGNTKFCRLFAARLNTKSSVNCDTDYGSYWQDASGNNNFETTDGMAWRVPTKGSGTFTGERTIYVDINGSAKPNCSLDMASAIQCPKPDRFLIFVDKYGKIRVNESTKKMLTASDITKTYKELQ